MGDFIARNLKKKVTRANEKLLQNLGKADKTTDEEFEDHCQNFHKQQKSADRLQKEVKAYVSSIKAMSAASRGFYEALREIYEPEWPAVEHVRALSESLELVWDDYHEKLQDQAVNPLNSYASQFADLDKKINKRGRKLVDFDGARHNLDTLSKTQKKPEDAKLIHAQKDLQEKKKLYEDLNTQLTDELPALYDSRITFYVNHFQTIFNLEHVFHNETAGLTRDLCNRMDDLGNALGRLRVPRRQSDATPEGTVRQSPLRPPQPISNVDQSSSPAKTNGSSISSNSSQEKSKEGEGAVPGVSVYPKLQEPVNNGVEGERESTSSNSDASTTPALEEREASPQVTPEAKKRADSNSKPKPTGKTEDDLVDDVGEVDLVPSKDIVKYKVRATHRYTAEDADELSFESGEVIKVIPFEDPDDQDEGWLMGVKENDGLRGVFPANFTKPI